MAFATQFTLTTGNKVSINFQSQQVEVSLTYQLEREDTDVLAVVQEKSAEVAAAHRLAWEGLHGAKVGAKPVPTPKTEQNSVPESAPPPLPVENLEPKPIKVPEPDVSTPSTPGQQAALAALLAHVGWSDAQTEEQLDVKFSVQSLPDLSRQQAASWLLELQRTEREKAAQRRLQSAQLNGKH